MSNEIETTVNLEALGVDCDSLHLYVDAIATGTLVWDEDAFVVEDLYVFTNIGEPAAFIAADAAVDVTELARPGFEAALIEAHERQGRAS